MKYTGCGHRGMNRRAVESCAYNYRAAARAGAAPLAFTERSVVHLGRQHMARGEPAGGAGGGQVLPRKPARPQ